MRPILCVLLGAFLASTSLAQLREGSYHPSSGPAIPWQINDHHTLVWNGEPYIPVGAVVEGSTASIGQLKTAGVADALVDLPASGVKWSEAIGALEANNLRYLIRIDSLAPMAQGIAVDPSAFRISDINSSQKIDISLPDAKSALLVLAQRRDASVMRTVRVPVVDGRLHYDLKLSNDLDTVLLIYPETKSLEQPDLWDGFDDHRDQLLGDIRKFGNGKGLRGLINPLGRCAQLPGKELHFVPTDASFRLELRNHLEDRYRNLETAMRAWAMSGSGISSFTVQSTEGDGQKKSLGSFEDLSRLVPLWAGTRGISQLWDPTTDRFYACDSRRSTIWADLTEVVNAATEHRVQHLVAALRSVSDVPVIQEWAGWSLPYEERTPAVDGIGMHIEGTSPSEIIQSGARAASSVLRWQTNGWLTATDINLGTSPTATAAMDGVLDDLTSLGGRGFFFRANSPADLRAIAAQGAKRANDPALASHSPTAVFFPENATNPATAQRLPGGKWWLPSPADGDRIDFGAGFYGYRINDRGLNRLVIWTSHPQRTLLRLSKPAGVQFATIDGSDPKPKISKQGIELDLNEYPLEVQGTEEVPVPQPAYKDTVAQFVQLVHDAELAKRDTTEEAYAFGQAANGFDRNPGGNYVQMRHELRKLGARLSPFLWIEAESSRQNNFSEVALDPGCSGGSALLLRSQIDLPGDYHADYNVQVKNKEDQVMWLAARIPAEHRSDLTVNIAGQTLSISGDPLSPYGAGYAWYRLGVTRFGGVNSQIKIQVAHGKGFELALDAILLTPRTFSPDGISLPSFFAKAPAP